jgi:Mechanosensitive ion channel
MDRRHHRITFTASMIARACAVTCWAALVPALIAGPSADAPQNSAYELPTNRQVIAFLLQSIDWYRQTHAERQIATDQADLLFLDDNRPIEAQIVRFSFDFAKADSALASKAASPHSQLATTALASSSSSELARFIGLQNQSDEANQKAAQDIESLKRKIGAARGADRAKLRAAMDETESRLKLLHAESNTIDDLVEFAKSAASGQIHTGDLGLTIDELAQTVPEVNTPAASLARLPEQDENSRQTSIAQDGSIIKLWSDVSALHRKFRLIDERMRLTDNLALSVQNMRAPMTQFISRLIQSGAVSSLRTGDLALLKQDTMQLDALTVELNSSSPAIVALDKQKVLLALYKSHLADWHSTVTVEYRRALKKLCIRLFVVALIMSLLIGVGEASRRVAERHVGDLDRRRRISIAHRLLTSAAVLVVAAVGFASELSSLATYFGLLTAGIAVALQQVILASVGHLLLVGKRGIKVGDRVQISGITGEVMDIGLLQFQLREFDLETQQFTGHVATFSNSLVFVSPATGLVKFHSADEKESGPEANDTARHSPSRT